MEVHHHPNTEKKKFKEYFLEFLMIFLAVTLGFLAENIRENISERAKEKEYIKGFINNLKVDTSNLKVVIKENKRRIGGIDSLLKMAHMDFSIAANRKLFYTYSRQNLLNVNFFKSDDVTLTQLRNSGGYRLIQKGSASDSIVKYDQSSTDVYGQETVYRRGINYTEEALFELIDMTTLVDTAYYRNKIFTDKELPAISSDPQKLKSFFNKTVFVRGVINNYTDKLSVKLDFAEKLISFLRKIYNLKMDKD